MKIKRDNIQDGVSIVVVGNFNPAIIHPAWLDRNQLLPPQEVRDIENNKKEKIHEIDGLKIGFIKSKFL